MTNKLPSGEAIRAGAAQPLDLEPIKRHILIYDEEIENSSEISYAEWEDNNDIMAGEDVRSLVAEVERLRTHAPQNQTAVELQTEACPACGEICPKGWCGVCHIAILTDWQKGFQRICEVAAMNLARAEKAEAEVSRLRASSGSPSMPLCDLCREGQGLFKPEEGYDIGNGCVNCAYQNHIGILEEQLRVASDAPERDTRLEQAQDLVQRLDVYQMSGTIDGQEFSYVLVRRAQVHEILVNLRGLAAPRASAAPPELKRYTPGGEWWDQMVEQPWGEWVRFEDVQKALSSPSPAPTWCAIHQHYKWCEHNGGVLGPSGYEAPSPTKEHAE